MNELVFTLDLEEWTHSENISPYKDKIKSNHSSLKTISMVLDFLDKNEIKGTFFCLGLIAKKNPELIEEISKQGHEIASHGWDHKLLHTMDSFELEEDITKTTNILAKVSGQEIVGYRSPCFSQNALLDDILVKNGYKYTSMGIKSSFHDRYSKNEYSGENLIDFSLPVSTLINFHIPATGGGWFRLLPVYFQKFLIKNSPQNPKIFYCHPWDFDNLQGDLDFLPLITKFRHKVNVKSAFKKMNKFNFHKKPLKTFLKKK